MDMTKDLRVISPSSLVAMDDLSVELSLRVDCAYASSANLLFGERIYRPDAKLWLHEDLAHIVMGAAKIAGVQGYRLILYDGLRTVEAQEKMLHTQRVQENPRWLEEPRLLSPPGAGAHPRGMAIDLGLETLSGNLLDMGTPFDFLASDPAPDTNPAHRNYQHLPEIIQNRTLLDEFMLHSASALKTELFLLPQEWWDYRLPASIYNLYAPLSDVDLPPEMQMCDRGV